MGVELDSTNNGEDLLSPNSDVQNYQGHEFCKEAIPPPSVLPESALVGAIGTAFHNTAELQVIKLYQALQSEDKEAWEEAIRS